MKRRIVAMLAFAAIALLLCGCTREQVVEEDYTVEIEGKTAVISKQNGTVTVGDDVYQYAYSADGVLLIVYPNGYGYSRKAVNSGGVIAYASSFTDAEGVPSDKTEEEFGYIGGFALFVSARQYGFFPVRRGGRPCRRLFAGDWRPVAAHLAAFRVDAGLWLALQGAREPSDMALAVLQDNRRRAYCSRHRYVPCKVSFASRCH